MVFIRYSIQSRHIAIVLQIRKFYDLSSRIRLDLRYVIHIWSTHPWKQHPKCHPAQSRPSHREGLFLSDQDASVRSDRSIERHKKMLKNFLFITISLYQRKNPKYKLGKEVAKSAHDYEQDHINDHACGTDGLALDVQIEIKLSVKDVLFS